MIPKLLYLMGPGDLSPSTPPLSSGIFEDVTARTTQQFYSVRGNNIIKHLHAMAVRYSSAFHMSVAPRVGIGPPTGKKNTKEQVFLLVAH